MIHIQKPVPVLPIDLFAVASAALDADQPVIFHFPDDLSPVQCQVIQTMVWSQLEVEPKVNPKRCAERQRMRQERRAA